MKKIKQWERTNKIALFICILGAAFITWVLLPSILEGIIQHVFIGDTIRNIVLLILGYMGMFIPYIVVKSDNDKWIKKEEHKIEVIQEFHLSTNHLIEVLWTPETDNPISRSRRERDNKYGVIYYAHLMSEDVIQIITVDKDGDPLCDPQEIEDFEYFKKHYKLVKQL